MGPEGFGEGEGSGMRWSLLIAVFGLSMTDVASLAQGPPEDQRPESTRSSSQHAGVQHAGDQDAGVQDGGVQHAEDQHAGYQDAGFFASTGVVRFQIIQGRLCLDAPRHRKGSQNREDSGVYESITVTAQRGIPSLHYVCQTQDHHLTLSVQKAEAVRIECWFPKTSERSVLVQPEFGPITWTHTHGDRKRTHTGTTLLHVRNSDPNNFDWHCGLLLQRLMRGQSLASLSDAAQSAMFDQIAGQRLPNVDAIHDCVDQLRSRSRAKRMEAERQLLTWGTPIIPAIHQLSKMDLEVEQAKRLRCILDRLRPRVDDTPSTLAKLLVNDHSYWSGIAHRLSSDQLDLANHHLLGFGVAALQVPVASTPEHRIASSRGLSD